MIRDSNFQKLLDYIHISTGINIPESHYSSVQSDIKSILDNKQISMNEYLDLLNTNEHDFDILIDSITIKESYFFRDEKHFIYLRDEILPELRNKKEINIWSASCSSGEEPLSLYSLLLDEIKDKNKFNIYASDISRSILTKFSKGNYRKNAFREDGKTFHHKIHNIAVPGENNTWTITQNHIKEIFVYKKNLFTPDFDNLPEMDIIFLRNTLIYMNIENKQKILNHVADKLKIGGSLFLSAVEMSLVSHPSLVVKGNDKTFHFEKTDPHDLSPSILVKKTRDNLNKTGIKYPTRKDILIPNEKDVCRVIELKLNNELFKEENEIIVLSADFFLRIIDSINLKKFSEVNGLLIKNDRHPKSLLNYFIGINSYHQNNSLKALIYFEKALQSNPKLWPAQYYLLKLIPDKQKNRKIKELNEVIQNIISYINEKQYYYQFLLDGFNARYFLLICEKMLNDLQNRSLDYDNN